MQHSLFSLTREHIQRRGSVVCIHWLITGCMRRCLWRWTQESVLTVCWPLRDIGVSYLAPMQSCRWRWWGFVCCFYSCIARVLVPLFTLISVGHSQLFFPKLIFLLCRVSLEARGMCMKSVVVGDRSQHPFVDLADAFEHASYTCGFEPSAPACWGQ